MARPDGSLLLVTHYRKSMNQLVSLLQVVGCEVDVVVKGGPKAA